jgi:hypothetical protein
LGKLLVMDKSGHTEVDWDVADPESVEKAKTVFQHSVLEGYYAYAVNATPDKAGQRKGRHITAFEPDAEKIVITPPMAGG